MAFFYVPDIYQDILSLSIEESKHCIKALRKKEGDTIQLTDGRGGLATAEISSASLTDCIVHIINREIVPPRNGKLHIAVAPTKNSDRMEWFVEKAVEIGIEKISFIICDHSERDKIDLQRLHRIAVSALKQSQTYYLPEMEIVDFKSFIHHQPNNEMEKLIAWCDDNNTEQLSGQVLQNKEVQILIGPEGDFSESEILMAKELNYKEIKLGNRRLRTETAALYCCCVMAAKNN
ncbi:MAG TPA: 16S rRNA (uracil(1498)-N(3))-methyltransferase [Bacteroidales bacterium]|jgi:16S rRNA (uracil1498-N3)-methyltransferase|nr:16S rRNA (uracil(1498)-N(3))-methyltransferase [Bacteroidales bacterium]HNW67826.1 16S rRNA (uracil(1498)-N(3))-methyltransferase [Bacteroidales bacterium]HPT52069.1 16S rRNA (uracil(1498)-N(3))-methyltransferase [Bacteroidales bacterium]